MDFRDGHTSHACRHDLFAVVSSWLDHKTPIPMELRAKMDELNALSSLDMQQTPALRNRAYDLSRRLRHLCNAIGELASAMKEEVTSFGITNRKCGLALLPDEVLIAIFDTVIHCEDSDDITSKEWKAAVGLSHVNRHFRSVTLAYPRFWTKMTSCKKMAAACLSRSKGLPLSICLTACHYLNYGLCAFDNVLSELLPFSWQWGRLDVLVEEQSDNRKLWSRRSIDHSLNQLDAPILEELHVSYSDASSVRKSPWRWDRWNTPNLRRVFAHFCFPHALPGLANVTTLSLTLSLDYQLIPNTFREISGMHHLQDLSLEISNEPADNQVLEYERLEFPQIRELTITTELYYLEGDHRVGLKRLLFSSLFFPGVTRLSLHLNGGDYENMLYPEDDYTTNFYFNQEITRIFRHPNQFPGVEDFHLFIFSPLDDHHDSDGYSELSIPFNMLPNLKHFLLDSNTRLDIMEPEEPEEIMYDEELLFAQRVVGDASPILQTVTLDMTDPSVVAGWLEDYLEDLKDRGAWEGFQKLTVVDWRIPESELVGGQISCYSREEALEWCSENRHESEDEESEEDEESDTET